MKIAVIGSGIYRAPTTGGKIHAPLKLAYDLAHQLALNGHDIKFFGIVDPRSKQKKLPFRVEDFGYKILFPKVSDYRLSFFVTYEQGFIAKALEAAKDYDIIYHFMPFRIGPLASFINVPIVATHHDSTHMHEYTLIYSSFAAKNLFLIPISEHSKKKLKYPNYLEVVYNGISLAEIPYREKPLDYFCWVGRIVPSKGLHNAINLAKKLHFKLKIAGPIQNFPDFGNNSEYLKEIKDEMKKNKNIEYVGFLNPIKARELMASSRALIFPSNGNESCPMTVIESMLAGTPVIATNLGPLPELITQGKTGFLCRSSKEMERAIFKIDKIDRKKCREMAANRFSLEVMAEGYEKQFKKALQATKNLSNYK